MDKLIYKSWDDITISLYKQMLEITEDTQLSATEINLAILALLMGIEEDEIYDYSVEEIQNLLPGLAFLNDFKFNQNWKRKKIVINGRNYSVETDLLKMTIAQYVDFQTYWAKKDNVQFLSNLLSCFIIPKGCKYNEGYDIAELIDTIENNLPITTANSILFFFIKESVTSIRAIQICLDWMLNKKKTKENQEQIMKLQIQMNQLFQEVFNGFL